MGDVNKVLDDKKIIDIKNYAKGTMDLAYLFSTVNLLQHCLKNTNIIYLDPIIALLTVSLVLQVTSSILLVIDHNTDQMNVTRRRRINITIQVFMVIIVFINIVATGVGSQFDDDEAIKGKGNATETENDE